MRQLCYMSYFMLLLQSKGVRQNYKIQTTSSLTTLLQTTNVKKCKVVTNVVYFYCFFSCVIVTIMRHVIIK